MSESNEHQSPDPNEPPVPNFEAALVALSNPELLSALDLALLELEKRLFRYAKVGPELLEMADDSDNTFPKSGLGGLGFVCQGRAGLFRGPALPHYSLVGVHSTHVARDVFDGCLHHRPVVGRRMDYRSISGGYAHVGDAIAMLIEEHQVSRLS
jgi:hypothetical protein